MNNLILCTYMYENSQSWANTIVYVAPNMEYAKENARSNLYDNASNVDEDDIDTIQHLVFEANNTETIETTIWDCELEYDIWGFRLTCWDETHVCRYGTIVEWLVVELS